MNIDIRVTAGRVFPLGGAVLAAVLLAGCASGATAAKVAAASPTSSATGFAAYADCLRQHGVTLPSRSPGAVRPSGTANRGGGFGGNFAQNPQMQAAAQACAALRPAGGAFGGGRGGTALAAFRTCMTQQGVTLPTTRPTAPPTSTPSGARYLGGLDPADPKVAAALKVCSPLLPTRSPGAVASVSPTS